MTSESEVSELFRYGMAVSDCSSSYLHLEGSERNILHNAKKETPLYIHVYLHVIYTLTIHICLSKPWLVSWFKKCINNTISQIVQGKTEYFCEGILYSDSPQDDAITLTNELHYLLPCSKHHAKHTQSSTTQIFLC